MGCGASTGSPTLEHDAIGRGHARASGATQNHHPPDKEKSLPVAFVSNSDSHFAHVLTNGANHGRIHEFYTMGRTIGTGGYAVVKTATNNATGRQVAIKVMTLHDNTVIFTKNRRLVQGDGTSRGSFDAHQRSNDAQRRSIDGRRSLDGHVRPSIDVQTAREEKKAIEELKYICSEIETLRELRHPAIMTLFEYFVSPNAARIYLVLELLPGGELLTALQRRGNYTEADARKAFVQVLYGLEYLHERKIIHRDLKLENLLLMDENDLSTVKLADFGLAKQMQDRRSNVDARGNLAKEARQTMCGTPMYMAPEARERPVPGPSLPPPPLTRSA